MFRAIRRYLEKHPCTVETVEILSIWGLFLTDLKRTFGPILALKKEIDPDPTRFALNSDLFSIMTHFA